MKGSLLKKLHLNFEFKFEYEGHVIEARASGISAKEEVFVDGESVSSRRNFGLSSTHEFLIEGETFKVHFDVGGFLLSTIRCDLLLGDDVVRTESQSSLKGQKGSWKLILSFFVIGLAAGFLSAKLALWLLG